MYIRFFNDAKISLSVTVTIIGKMRQQEKVALFCLILSGC